MYIRDVYVNVLFKSRNRKIIDLIKEKYERHFNNI